MFTKNNYDFGLKFLALGALRQDNYLARQNTKYTKTNYIKIYLNHLKMVAVMKN